MDANLDTATASAVTVADAADTDASEWNSYVEGHPLAHHAHRFEWRSIFGDVFGHRALYLLARRSTPAGSQVTGVLPLFHFKSVLFGRALISVPYLNGGGILADDSESFNSLLSRAEELAREYKVDYLELRHRSGSEWSPERLTLRTHKVAMTLPLTGGAEEVFSRFPAKLRSQVRRPSKSGVVSDVSAKGRLDRVVFGNFYDVFSENMRDLGTPVYPRALFQRSLEAFGDRARVITVSLDGQPLAAGITLGLGRYVEIPWASSLRRYNKYSPNMLLYWQSIKTACDDGYEIFDFGRSSAGSSTHKFKEQWGAVSQPLHWYYSSERGIVPDVNPNSPKFQLMVNCWRRLPLFAANSLGPWLTRSLP